MKLKTSWQKIALKGLTYTLVAVLASATTLAALGQRSTSLDDFENTIGHKLAGQTNLEKVLEELANEKAELQESKKELEAGKKELEESKQKLEQSKQELLETSAQLNATKEATQKLLEELLEANKSTQEMLEDAKTQIGESADRLEELQQAYKEAEEKANQRWIVPMKYDYVSSPFGYRTHPIDGVVKFHYGVDLAAVQGTPIVATRGGTVKTTAYQADGAGYYVTIDHGDGYESQYLHMREYIVKKGQVVIAGQVIGYCGSTGASTGPHLDFRIFHNGEAVNPAKYIDI